MIAGLVDRLAAECGAVFRRIGDAAELAAIEAVTQTPAAFVVPLAETGSGRDAMGAVIQDLTIRFAVLVVQRRAGDRTGSRQAALLGDLRNAVKDALIGWPPEADDGPCRFVRGSLLDLEAGELRWADEYEFTRQYRRTG